MGADDVCRKRFFLTKRYFIDISRLHIVTYFLVFLTYMSVRSVQICADFLLLRILDRLPADVGTTLIFAKNTQQVPL